MDAVQLWRRMLAGEPGEQILCDVGTTTVSGVRAPGAPELAERAHYVGHPVLQNVALDASDTSALDSDFARVGLTFEQPEIVEDIFTDPFGIDWLWSEGTAAPLNHPLEKVDYIGVARHRKPEWPTRVQVPAPAEPGAARPLYVADAPCSGLLETCFYLRNSWQFMIDITDNWRVANALLDWSLEAVVAGYERMLSSLPTEPDLVLYGDDYGYQGGMFLSDEDFRTFIKPRLRTLFSRIGRLTSAPIVFHCCGAINTILGDLADLGPCALNLQYDAKGMELNKVRAKLPGNMVLHGYTDLRALGTALVEEDRKSIAILTDELVQSIPVVAAPVDSMADDEELFAAARAARFVHALSADDIERLRRLGPVRDVLDRAAEVAAEEVPQLTGKVADAVVVGNTTGR